MITYSSGDILRAPAWALVNPVNCVGIMGRGLALQFKQAFRANFDAYVVACARGEVRPGTMFVHGTGTAEPPQFIINFPTKRHWREKSRIGDIADGLLELARVIRDLRVPSVAIPQLGCGLGGLDWCEVLPLIKDMAGSLPEVRVVVFGPPTVQMVVPDQH